MNIMDFAHNFYQALLIQQLIHGSYQFQIKAKMIRKNVINHKTIKTIGILTILLTIVTSVIDQGDATIEWISIDIDKYTAAKGSELGGTTVYIKGTNFNADASRNSIYIGNYPCILKADGSSETLLVCQTTEATNPAEKWGLNTRVIVGSAARKTQNIFCSAANCKFNYDLYITPFIEELYPTTAVGGGDLYTLGIHRITNIGDGRSNGVGEVKNLLIDGLTCSLVDFVQLASTIDTFGSNYRQAIGCTVYSKHVAGEYDFVEKLKPGLARKSYRAWQTSLWTSKNYTIRIAPNIKTMSVHKGGTQGQLVGLTGTGFSSNIADYGCKVAGQTCTVVEVGQDKVTVKVPKPVVNDMGLVKNAADTSTQVKNFLGSQGFEYTRYDRTDIYKGSMQNWYTFIKGSNNTMPVLSNVVTTQVSSAEVYGQKFAEYIRGYFYAPTAGDYTFSAVVDDSMIVKLARFENNANSNIMETILTLDNFLNDNYITYVRKQSVSTTKTLQQGYYYMEVISLDGGGNAFYKVAVEMPNPNPAAKIINPAWQLERFSILPSVQKEVLQIDIMAASGSVDLYYLVIGDAVPEKKMTINPATDTAAQFNDKLYNLWNIYYYNPSTVKETLDASGAVTTVAANVKGYRFTVSITRYRGTISLPSFINDNLVAAAGTTKKTTITRITDHSPPLSGTYRINIDGSDLMLWNGTHFANADIPFNTGAGALEVAWRNKYPNSQIQVRQVMGTIFVDQIIFVVQYVGYLGAPASVQINKASLSGGIAGTTPTATYQVLRSFSATRQLFNPIPYQFLRVASVKPTLTLTVNSIPALCSDCTYQFDSSKNLAVSSSSLSGSTLSISLSNPGSVVFALTDVTVTLLGQACTGLTGTTSSFTCTFQTNGDSTPKLPAGSEKPIVHITQVGFANTDAITAISKSLTVSSITPSAVAPGGGVYGVIIGTGLPLKKLSTVSITLCGNVATDITLTSNQQIRFKVPKQVVSCASNSNIIVNGQSASLTFNYDPTIAPSVSSLSPTSASPILKSVIHITGASYGSIADTKVFLVKSGIQQYELGIINMTSTEIYAILGGGKTGTYDVVVKVDGVGYSTNSAQSVFNYKIVVTSVSPVQGPLGGGYDLTITGLNFATSSGSSFVSIGEQANNICQITSVTSTQIVCKMPRMSASYTVGTNLIVTVTGRVIEESICQGTCDFQYVDANTPKIIVPSQLQYNAGEIITVQADTGTDLTGATVKVGGVDCPLAASSSSSALTFTYPALVAGSYQVLIKVGNTYTHPIFSTTTVLWFANSLSQSTGSNQGHILSISGNGMTKTSTDVDLKIWLICGSVTTKLAVVSATSSLIKFQLIPKGATSSCSVNVTYLTTFKLIPYTYSSALTPGVTITLTSGSTYQMVKTNVTTQTITSVKFVYLGSSNTPTTSIYPMTITNINTTHSTLTSSVTLPAGIFKALVHSDVNGYSVVNPTSLTRAFPATPTISSSVTASFVGGLQLQITGAGFIQNQMTNNDIQVCGLQATVSSVDSAKITVIVPALVTAFTQNLYQLSSNSVVRGQYFSDNANAAQLAFDGSPNTVYTSTNAVCYIGWDFGSQGVIDVSSIRFMPNPKWVISANYLQGSKFQGSNDNTVWTTIFNIDTSSVHSGWNYWAKLPADSIVYRYVRFSHSSTSKCQLADIQFTGKVLSTQSVTAGVDKSCGVSIFDGSSTRVVIPNAVTYSHAATSVVTSISPRIGSSAGGTTITIVGTNFGSTLVITIDGRTCTISSQTSTQIRCVTTSRPSPPLTGNTFTISSDGNQVKIATQPFKYVDRWSDQATWGGEALPRTGDTVLVPKGMTLLVDVSTPVLDTVMVLGKIQFADEADTTFDAHYFVINEGEFQAGLETSPYQHKLTFTLHGGYFDKQLPTFGNKVIACRNCKFNMHGKVRDYTWTQLATTVMPNDNTFTLTNAVDWQVGEQVAVASSTFDHYESQMKTISAVSGDKKTFTVDSPFVYRHFSGEETYGTQKFAMRAEVGLLTRNIKVQGNEISVGDRYGSHLMMNGKQSLGLVAKISYTEFTKCGQPKIIGRYCTHFHMAGEVPESYVRGIAVHHSMARVITIHGTHFLLVEKNVGFHVEGHNYFVQDGIETNNVIQDNLAISSITSLTLLQSDITVASFWITNPYNTVRRNHAAGGDFYGFWYEIMQHPEGPSATSDICPMGMMLGESRDNVAHSNRRFGLRIFKLSARKYPCLPSYDESLEDPYSSNPAYESVFDNYTLWRNEECGFLGEELGYTTIKNFKTADSRKGGLQFHKTNFTKQFVEARDCLVVGYSQGNAPANVAYQYRLARGLIASRTDGFRASGITFYNFASTMTPLQSCSDCYHFKLWVVGSKTTHFNRISYNNIAGSYIFWQKWRREVFVDEDGTLTAPLLSANPSITTPQPSGSITPYRPSLDIAGKCTRVPTLWDDSLFCDSTIVLRSILFANAAPVMDFAALDIRVRHINNLTQNVSTQDQTLFSIEPLIVIKPPSMDIVKTWAMPFAVNHIFNVHWKWGVDFLHMALAPSRLWTVNQGVLLRFNYTDYRELYEIGKWFSQKLQTPYIQESITALSPTNCTNGQYIIDRENRYLFVCVSGRNKKVREWTDINAIRCRTFCPVINPDGNKENFQRLWSNKTQWKDSVLPTEGQNITIPYEWNLKLDISPPILNYLKVDGDLTFDPSKDITLQAHYIWVNKGKILIGSQSAPYPMQANIILHGQKDDDYLVLDPDASGNKMLAVTGGLEFYGNVTTTNIWTRLTSIAPKGATTLNLASVNGWKVGDKIVVAPSYAGRTEYEQVTITGISGNTVTIDKPLVFQHYGDGSVTINNTYGTMDTRSAVGLLTRNIKITRGADINGWGCRVQIYQFWQRPEGGVTATNPPILRRGYVKFDGVELDGCGQYDTGNAGIRIQKIGTLGIQTSTPAPKTEIMRSSVYNCVGICMYIDTVSNLSITNNVFYWARKFLVYVEQVNNYEFTNNLLVGARKRPQITTLQATHMVDDVACYEQYIAIDFINGVVNVSKNLAQGSEGQGFVFPATTCDRLSTYNFVQNTAGSCEIAFMVEKLDGKTCLSASKMYGYASEIGLQANMPGSHTKIIYENCIFTDNQRGITLRYAHDIDDNTCILRNSYFAGFSRNNCPTCYSQSTINYCKGGYAVRMFTSTISGQTFPLKKKNTVHDVICTRQSYDFRAYLDNVVFENYRTTSNNINTSYCTQMSVFKRHDGASDGTASHYLNNTYCNNCQNTSWAYFDQPSTGWRGWFGGCGQIDCTGPNNYFIHDQDGKFTGTPSQILANNSWIGQGQPSCTQIKEMNGYWCKTEELAVMEYESIAPDFNKRIMWPVYLKYDTGNWNSSTNGWKQWEWNGPEPMNLRLARFWSVVKLHQNYNLTYSGQPPADSRFQIQQRRPGGNPADWVIIRIYYPLPNSIEILVKNSTGQDISVKPFPIKSGVAENLRNYVNTCGANNFHYTNGTIQFVLNGNNCQVRVKVSSFIKLSTKLDIPIADFYKNTNLTSFVTNMCAFLGIDTGRMKIVGIRQGSVDIDFIIIAGITSLDSSTNAVPLEVIQKDLNSLSALINQGLSSGTMPLPAPLLSYSSQTTIVNVDGTVYEVSKTTSNMVLIIALVVAISSMVIILGVGTYCYIKRRRQRISQDDSIQAGESDKNDFISEQKMSYIKPQYHAENTDMK